ncbi:methyltransferase family protein [Cytobacillus horneckiae]|uniref:Class I SAM-dependent methyltransferase n=1 Tax=Cytobacillus horneckiae TaxID=549687 RepID=A0A2N0ZGP8_9BACI|nr:methyltransferase domain-containing protein [Cytobacillus horneckiae]MBN6886523.1 class I SAM-dependent methyltransferase [Cytobacillus horneckiae]MEC1157660.1 methyltransferase domain-containing protein [Cytobacillus horneckiae]MED2939671.1 methyltransferase domain-containing protein [Cytobacillus horneckiae]PKG28679.1 class I SAM-dependent methyltransferase [Cytobacillus horneckiae]
MNFDSVEGFSGWDFSYITETGRMASGLLSWSYGSRARILMNEASSMLDMGTGGGEFLSYLRPFPPSICATEGYQPNVKIAKERLEPLGVKVKSFAEDTKMPFADQQFDLILNKHESYSAKEVRRMLMNGGDFLTQQAGGTDCVEINQMLGVPLNADFADWDLNSAVAEIKENHFDILFQQEEKSPQRFYDIGALIYYLKAIPWQIPDFTIDKYQTSLNTINQMILTKGYFEVLQHRFIIHARAI